MTAHHLQLFSANSQHKSAPGLELPTKLREVLTITEKAPKQLGASLG